MTFREIEVGFEKQAETINANVCMTSAIDTSIK
jgi:hypothetical protein